LANLAGFFNIDKPYGITSHDVVSKVRRGIGMKKVGHAGTLDPLATGVLVVCIGGATRLSDYVMHTHKRYQAQVVLGVATTTYDAEGDITAQHPAEHITQADVEAQLPQFIGTIQQLPPMYSAIKKDGKKLYELARAGETIALEPRTITIHTLNILDWSTTGFTLDIICEAGTYIRSLAHDLGAVLGVGAHLGGLRRTASGAFKVENALNLEQVIADGTWAQHLIAPADGLGHLPAVDLDPENSDHIRHGRRAEIIPDQPIGTIARAHDSTGEFFALLRADKTAWYPHKVFHSE
jgi:tRNA pseudouridine55 synthase